jgi:hypothetical protein
MSILTPNDFDNGRFAIAINPNQTIDLQLTIDYVERTFLPKLFGVELYDLFIANLAALPLSTRFEFVYNTFNYKKSVNHKMVHSEGIKTMLKAFTYYLYVRGTTSTQTTVGIKQSQSDNSENVSAIHHGITLMYNDGVETFKAIQFYMISNKATYSEYDGENIRYNHAL